MSAAPEPRVLAVNAGSSSIKFGLYGRDGPALWQGSFSGLQPGGVPSGQVDGAPIDDLPAGPAGGSVFAGVLDRLMRLMLERDLSPTAVAHRIVHGGDLHTRPCRLNASVLADLARLNTLAPLHQPHNLAAVWACFDAWPGVPQVACFDTAFHADLPAAERRLPLPQGLHDLGLRRYGFHGLSYQYVLGALQCVSTRAPGRCVLLHLGNGASACAVHEGRSVATTMGFSALDGLMMGTRCGSLDPGVLLYLWRNDWSLRQVEHLLYEECGLLGVSGRSADMRDLRQADDASSRAAVALFTRRVVREVGALVALLGGVDLIAFTGGIGEHDAVLRADVAAALAFAGVAIDARANEAAIGCHVAALHVAGAQVEVWVVPTDEGRVAASAALELL